jgi:protein O-GlcNAc transferase
MACVTMPGNVGDRPLGATAFHRRAREMESATELIEKARQNARSGNLLDAESLLRRAIALDPVNSAALNELGCVLYKAGNLPAAVDAFERGLAIQPHSAYFASTFGNVLRLTGKFDKALIAYRSAVQLSPLDPVIMRNLAALLMEMGNVNESVEWYRKAVEAKPDYAAAHNELGAALGKLGQSQQAISSFRQAIRMNPRLAAAYSNLAGALSACAKYDEALVEARQAIELDAKNAAAHSNLGSALWHCGRIELAIESIRRSIELAPKNPLPLQNYLFSIHFHPNADPAAVRREHEAWGARFAAPIIQKNLANDNERLKNRRLRVGYVSRNFRAHPECAFLLPLLERHDRSQFEVVCYSDNPHDDAVTQRLRQSADNWRPTRAMSDAELAQQVRADRIDVLIDLTMHMPGSRLLAFARKPAPIQIAYLAYPGTTGLVTMDYRLTDGFLDPPGEHEDHYTEEMIRLPNTFACYDPAGMEGCPDEKIPAAAQTPPVVANGFITFGVFNNLGKVNFRVLELWAGVLNAISSARLRMIADSAAGRGYVLECLGRFGVNAARVDFVGTLSRSSYFAEYSGIDISLDTLPYSGHTTGLDSFWMGVPVVTRVGDTASGRALWSVTSNLGLPDLAAHDDDQFVRLAVHLADDTSRLIELRRTLRARMQSSPVMDGPRFARDIEAVYRQTWKNWCSKPP